MSTSRLPLAALLLCIAPLVACGDDSNAPGASESGDVVERETCYGTLQILQKDAYKDEAGRTSALWPPHTTTVFEVQCGDGVVASTFQANHGTKPGAVDAAGDVILVQTGVLEVEGSQADLLALADAFDACSCDGATTFLSLDTLDDEVAADLLNEVGAYLGANLVCPGVATDELVGWLSAGDIDAVLATLPTCTWADGTSLEEGLDEAMAAIAEATGGILDDHHVCNNDASLQVELVEQFDASGEVKACDASSPICHGPLWFYDPLPNER